MGVSLDAGNALERAIDGKIAKAAAKRTRASGTVTRVDADGTAYVMLDGSEAETPASGKAAEVRAGERVGVTVSGGSLTIDGNYSAPSTDDRAAQAAQSTADAAVEYAGVAASAAASAQASADDAAAAAADAQNSADAASNSLKSVVSGATTVEKAVSVMQTALEAVVDYDPLTDTTTEYFWHDANGAHVLGDESGYRNDINSSGMDIKQVSTETTVAQFGASGAQIGKSGESHVELDYHSMRLVDKEGDEFFHVSDLRGHDGTAEISENFTADGTTVNFFTTFSIYDSNCTVTVDGVEVTSGITIMPQVVKFTSPPSDGAVVELDYLTDSQRAKSYTFGERRANSKIGALSVGEGLWPSASGAYSHSEGYGTSASGSAGHSEGAATQAIGPYSHTEGQTTKARALCSHAEGQNSEANGQNSHAQNLSTIASSDNQTALGKHNIEDANNTYAVIVGNGTADNARSNAAALRWDGTLELAKPLPVAGGGTGTTAFGTHYAPTMGATKNVSNNAWTQLHNFKLGAGKWLIIAYLYAAAHATGYRAWTFTTSSTAPSAVTLYGDSLTIPGGNTAIYTVFPMFVEPSAETTYYAWGYQNSGVSLNMRANLTAIRLG